MQHGCNTGWSPFVLSRGCQNIGIILGVNADRRTRGALSCCPGDWANSSAHAIRWPLENEQPLRDLVGFNECLPAERQVDLIAGFRGAMHLRKHGCGASGFVKPRLYRLFRIDLPQHQGLREHEH
jgi:hypothetical protein